jgi:putative transposase
VKGHKRNIIVDILGKLLHINVHAANKSDTSAACDELERAYERYPSIQAYSRDAGYRGTSSIKFIYEKINLALHYFSEMIQDIWAVLQKRWVVECTFSWLYNFRCLAKGFEILTWTSKNMIRIAKCV